ncbi:MAG: CCA tRNA nucleotidyltransferase [Lentisphaeraceae bacterium]|nr:CCA tRNA nucleotidyltransferase [Lentisphaeraceae bacterium]
MLNFCEMFDHPIYLVGGYVRDQLLGVDGKDVDIASSLHPREFKKKCQQLKIRTIDTGIEHGTVTAIIDGVHYEHTTFRLDVSTDGRNATIRYSDTIEEDLSRRDFTINAIAKLNDEIIDPYNGVEDLKNKILKTVGVAEERFSEDYLRIIRAARFQARFDLTLAEGLKEAAVELSPKIIEHVSIERVTDEIRKAQKHGKSFFECADNLGFLSEILPESNELTNDERNAWLLQIDKAADCDEVQYFSAIFLPLKPKDISKLAKRFKLSNVIVKGLKLIEEHTLALADKEITASELRLLKISLKSYFEAYCQRIQKVRSSSDIEQQNLELIKKLEPQVDASIANPYIDGAYLKNEGLKPSPFFKEIIDLAGSLQSEGKNLEEISKIIAPHINRHKS